MPDSEKYVSYKQAFQGMIALAALLVTTTIAVWGHELNQDRKIESNAKRLEQTINNMEEIKILLRTQIEAVNDTRERVIRIEEKIKK